MLNIRSYIPLLNENFSLEVVKNSDDNLYDFMLGEKIVFIMNVAEVEELIRDLQKMIE